MLYGAMPKRTNKPVRPNTLQGKPVTGRIVRMLFGQSHGFIRLPTGREVYFHRADLQEGAAFNCSRTLSAARARCGWRVTNGPVKAPPCRIDRLRVLSARVNSARALSPSTKPEAPSTFPASLPIRVIRAACRRAYDEVW
jgi:hypothetical protein